MAKNEITDEQLEQLKRESDVLQKIIKILQGIESPAARARVLRASMILSEGAAEHGE